MFKSGSQREGHTNEISSPPPQIGNLRIKRDQLWNGEREDHEQNRQNIYLVIERVNL